MRAALPNPFSSNCRAAYTAQGARHVEYDDELLSCTEPETSNSMLSVKGFQRSTTANEVASPERG